MDPAGRYAGKKVLVTGAASGLGRALAVSFAQEGADVVVVDINDEGLADTRAEVETSGRSCLARCVDVSDRTQMEAMAKDVLAEWGRVDILVNNAGVGVGGELKDIPLDDLEWIMGINLMGEIYGTKLFLGQMVERGKGHIVNVASLSGLVLLPFHLPYTTTKFGIKGFSDALWAELRRYGIGVTLVCPGPLKSNIMRSTRVHMRTERQEKQHGLWVRMIEERGEEPRDAAARILDAIENERYLLLWGFRSYLLYYLNRLSPSIVRRLVAHLTARMSK